MMFVVHSNRTLLGSHGDLLLGIEGGGGRGGFLSLVGLEHGNGLLNLNTMLLLVVTRAAILFTGLRLL